MAARRRLKDIEGQRARLARRVVASSSAVVVRPAAIAHEPDGGPECQPNAEAPLLRDEGARRKWVEEELFRCCEVRRPAATACLRPARLPCFQATASNLHDGCVMTQDSSLLSIAKSEHCWQSYHRCCRSYPARCLVPGYMLCQ